MNNMYFVKKYSKVTFDYIIIFFFLILPVDNKLIPPLLIILILLSLIKLEKNILKVNWSKYKKYYLPFIVYFILCCLSLIWTEDFFRGLKQLETRLLFLVAPLIFLINKLEPIKVYNWLKAYCYSVLVLSSFFFVYGLISYAQIYSPSIKYPYYAYLFVMSEILDGFGIHRSYFSISLLIAIMLIFGGGTQLNKIKKLISVVFLSAMILLFQSKMNAIILVCIFILFWALSMRRLSVRLKIVYTAVLLLFLTFSGLVAKKRFAPMFKRIENRDAFTGRNSTEERYQYLEASFALAKETPILGYGIGDVNQRIKSKAEEIGLQRILEKKIYDPHNEFIKIYLGLGVVGLISIIILFYKLFSRAITSRNIFLLGITWAVFCSCFTESYLSRQGGIVPFLIFSCLLIQFNPKQKVS